MASHHLFSLVIISITSFLILRHASGETSTKPLPCFARTPATCDAVLYHNSTGLTTYELATFYSVNSSAIADTSPPSSKKIDHLITVRCSCSGNLTGYIYHTAYLVQPNDTFAGVSSRIYSGQALSLGGEEKDFIAGNFVTMKLLCGCIQNRSVLTYTVQKGDFLTTIAKRFSSSVEEIIAMNKIQDPSSMFVGQVLFVPRDEFKTLLRY